MNIDALQSWVTGTWLPFVAEASRSAWLVLWRVMDEAVAAGALEGEVSALVSKQGEFSVAVPAQPDTSV